jgi:hypothetical protein
MALPRSLLRLIEMQCNRRSTGRDTMTLLPLGPVSNDGRDEADPPRIPYYSLWAEPRPCGCTSSPARWRPCSSRSRPWVGSASGMRARSRNGWCRYLVTGSSRRRMARVSGWDPATSIGGRISPPASLTAADVIDPDRSVMNLACTSWSNSRHRKTPAVPAPSNHGKHSARNGAAASLRH